MGDRFYENNKSQTQKNTFISKQDSMDIQDLKQKYVKACYFEISTCCKQKKEFWLENKNAEQIKDSIPYNAYSGKPYMKSDSIFILCHQAKNDFKNGIYLSAKEAKEISPQCSVKQGSYGIKVMSFENNKPELITLYNIEQFNNLDSSKFKPKNMEYVEKVQQHFKENKGSISFKMLESMGIYNATMKSLKAYLISQSKGEDFIKMARYNPQDKIHQKPPREQKLGQSTNLF